MKPNTQKAEIGGLPQRPAWAMQQVANPGLTKTNMKQDFVLDGIVALLGCRLSGSHRLDTLLGATKGTYR